MTICSECSREYLYDRSKGHSKRRCNSCCANVRKEKVKDLALTYLGRECNRCGYKQCAQALHFHHLDPSAKDFTISGSHTRKWEVIQRELDKCILLCANCHAEAHYQ